MWKRVFDSRTKTCLKCKHQIPEHAYVCPKCGTEKPEHEEETFHE